MPTPFVHGPQSIVAPLSVGLFPHLGESKVLYGGSQPSLNESSIPTTSLKLPFRMPSYPHLDRRKMQYVNYLFVEGINENQGPSNPGTMILTISKFLAQDNDFPAF